MQHPSANQLEAALDHVRASPTDHGVLELIVRRPAVDEREVLEEAELSVAEGLVGDTWRSRGDKRTADGSANRDKQLNVMNARAAAAVAVDLDRRALAGDQLYVDFDLSLGSSPAGTRLRIGAAVIEITEEPHRGCAKFSARFGVEALRWVNDPTGRELCLRGVNARVVSPGRIRTGDAVVRLEG